MLSEIRPYFWKNYSLNQLTPAEWEALCDGCGQCCLVKLQDDEVGEVAYTRVACKLLDCQSGSCRDYANRRKWVPDCLQLTPELVATLTWLPQSCAYRRIFLGMPLPDWHYLISGDRRSVIRAKKSVAGRCISEDEVAEDELEDHIVRWVKM